METNSGKSYDLYYTRGQTKPSQQCLIAYKSMDSEGLSLPVSKWFIVHCLFFSLSPYENVYHFLILLHNGTVKIKKLMTVYYSQHVKDCKCLVTVMHYQKTFQNHNPCTVLTRTKTQMKKKQNILFVSSKWCYIWIVKYASVCF